MRIRIDDAGGDERVIKRNHEDTRITKDGTKSL
jgi:hypothetical protein